MEQVEELHRLEAWNALPSQYAALRRVLIEVRGGGHLTNQQRAIVVEATLTCKDMKGQVERFLYAGTKTVKPPDRARLNAFLAKDQEQLILLLAVLKQN